MKLSNLIDDLEYQGRRLVSKSQGVIFVWIPKTAGTSLFEALQLSLGMKMYKKPHRLPRIRGLGYYTFCHLHYPSLRRMKIVSDPVHRNSFKFAITRDPYRRAVSLYFYLLRPDMNDVSGSEFNQFLKDVMKRRPAVGVQNHAGLMHANPQVDWLIGENGLVVDELFDIENLRDCLEAVYRHTGRAVRELHKRNVSGYDEQCADDLLGDRDNRQIIEHIYQRDFEVLGYPKLPEVNS